MKRRERTDREQPSTLGQSISLPEIGPPNGRTPTRFQNNSTVFNPYSNQPMNNPSKNLHRPVLSQQSVPRTSSVSTANNDEQARAPTEDQYNLLNVKQEQSHLRHQAILIKNRVNLLK